MRSWIIPAVLVIILDWTVSTTLSPVPLLQTFNSLITTLVVLLVGLTLR
ncbi:hypothetical protein [Arcanobacterium hippocoleae]